MRDIQDFDNISIHLASPEMIRAWSYGEVKKPETINYRTLRPERDGLFCERIFGTTKEWECYCGKFKSIRYKGVICDRCGVEVTHFRVRRERMGHIELACPVSHIWFYRSVPSRMGLLLDLPVAALRSILYYEKFIVIDPGETELKKMELLTEEEYNAAQDRFGGAFTAGMGAEAIRSLLEQINLDELAAELREKMIAKGPKADKRLLKRIEIVESFRNSNNRPEWMILSVIPVIPPELRPMVQLDGGRFATSDLNDLYRRVINRNNRLKRLQNLNAPEIIIRNEKRMLQEAVDALFDNTKKKRVVKGASNRPLKSLSDMLKGKQGRFRQNLLGKRVDYSGRSVIVVGPELKMWQCGLPTKMALELFKPFIMKKLVEKDVVYNIKKAKMLVESETPEVFAVLDEVVKEHPVLLNRAPTLHRLGIQAFEPVLVEGKAIKLHPLVCKAFNADFDGDQMAVHVPLTNAAQAECWTLMLSSRNLLDPANGKTIVYPSQDIVLGINFLTRPKKGVKGEGKRYSSADELLMACESGACDYQAEVRVPATKSLVWEKVGRELELPANHTILTTAGRILLNEAFPAEVPFINYSLTDKDIRSLVENVYKLKGPYVTVTMLDAIKNMGFKYATFFGATIGMDDIVIPAEKASMIDSANKQVESIQKQYLAGHITQDERYNRVVEVWSKTNEELTSVMMKALENDKGGFNNIYMMAYSGARGSRNQIRQLAGMRGLMAKPSGDIIELPIRSNFREGLSVIEFFISTNGARKGLADTALKTADAGYLTRRLVDIAQDMVVNVDDCGTINGSIYTAIKDGEEIIEPLRERIIGRFTLDPIRHPITGEVIVESNQEITEEIAALIEASGIEEVTIRTVLTCEARYGVCRKCYGRNLATGRTVDIGEAVGIIAAQSIGQPGTQLTMRTFHIGGAATKASEENRVYLKYPVYVTRIQGTYVPTKDNHYLFTRKGYIYVCKVFSAYDLAKTDKLLVRDGDRVLKGSPIIKKKSKGEEILAQDISYAKVLPAEGDRGQRLLLIAQEQKLEIRNGSDLSVKEGDLVPAEDTIAIFDPFTDPIISEYDGYVRFEDIIPGSTLKEEINEETGNIDKRITEFALERDSKQPRIIISDEAGNEIFAYLLPGGAYLNVEDGESIKAGRTLAKILKESAKAMDITGGLPRVGELFEARKSKNPAILAMVSGKVSIRGNIKNKRLIVITDRFGKEYKHLVPMGRRLLVRDNDMVEAGELLCDGSKNPHDILAILGEQACQRYLMDEVQQVYRAQGVTINDKHIGVIIRQMMKKVEIVSPGDTRFIYGQQVDKYRFHEENERVIKEGGQPAVARPMLLGITRASLKIDSFFSAASFQETTKVLTDAAIAGSVDGLRGLKENVIIGHLIPAGTGMKVYKGIKLSDGEHDDLDGYVEEILEKRKLEKEMAPIPALEDRADANGSFEEETVFDNDAGFEAVNEDE
ncbi:RNA polymerase, beta prime subunit [uncultured Spirochaetota bacterium]|uniref:DNA-directed RNA polymerase subunit beta' n=1 Tax=uncultured Spirochaetota bacterium TaxID=460511 RepID=A0A652ZS93_9SPIR|nr:RNA polymerase, beta prime subunit [uncultured Spirochaetota bacterium]